MPKIIKDIKYTIFNSAMDLFSQEGYENVDMKIIAQKCGIAVGTLYNYYSNKKELYFDVLEKILEDAFNKLPEIINSNISSSSKVNDTIRVLYDDIEKRKGLVFELIKSNIQDLSDDNRIINFKNKLFLNIKNLIDSLDKKDEFNINSGLSVRLTETLLITLPVMIQAHSNEKEQNINFLNSIVNLFVK